ncbi:MAG: hypothetical protein HY897_01605 [Deltaproteobacteria bacterium]|nr:hypothetical protein [Deltaproteobacteria bacterium]
MCDDGYHWSGERCVADTTTESCDGVDCGGHGACLVIPDGRAVCDCEAGYFADADKCIPEGGQDPCLGWSCSGHGTCIVIEPAAAPFCACDEGFHNAGPSECLRDEHPSGNHWTFVLASNDMTCAIESDNSLWCWGGAFGHFRDPQLGDALSPVRIGNDGDWTTVSAGRTHNCALKTDNSLWCWGWRLSGAIGNGELNGGDEVELLPVKINPP